MATAFGSRERARWSGVAVAISGTWVATRPAPPRVSRLAVATAGLVTLVSAGGSGDVAVTPDGSHIIYRGENQLLVRLLDRLEPSVLTRGTSPGSPFSSPDGQWVGFFEVGQLRKVAITAGPSVLVTAVSGQARGATWGATDVIVFATNASTWAAAGGGGWRRGDGAHDARSNTRRNRSRVARVPAGRARGPLYDSGGRRRTRRKSGRIAGSRNGRADRTAARWESRALRANRSYRLRSEWHAARCGIRSFAANGRRDPCAGDGL